jgi:hypothetical protein
MFCCDQPKRSYWVRVNNRRSAGLGDRLPMLRCDKRSPGPGANRCGSEASAISSLARNPDEQIALCHLAGIDREPTCGALTAEYQFTITGGSEIIC